MARFYGSVNGGRNDATRCGHSHIVGHVRGWHLGGKVECHRDSDDADVTTVSLTSGSSVAGWLDQELVEARRNERGETEVMITLPGTGVARYRVTPEGEWVQEDFEPMWARKESAA